MASRYGSTKRYGSRYGRKIKEKVGKIEEERKQSSKCPYCRKDKIKRLAAGLWYCSKCDVKLTGKAYVVGRKTPITALPEETTATEESPVTEDSGTEENEAETA